ncbi:MAG: hypothetical protein M8467_09725 [Anaerolineae bacterium]|nr:hypothetical protein [Anaerolineae bacterium]
MNVQMIREMRRLYRTDPQFCRALQDDPTAALNRWKLQSPETAQALAGPLRALLSRSPEEVLVTVAEEIPDWDGVPPELVISG